MHVFVSIKNDALLEKYHKILDKVSSSVKKGFDSQQVHYEESKKKSYQGKIKKKIHVDGLDSASYCIC